MMAMQARCPQWWRVFSVRGRTGTYEVYCRHVLRGTWRCCSPAHRLWPDTPCRHIERVLENGCLAGPACKAGLNDLGGAEGVSITNKPDPVPRLYSCTDLPCACGEMMRAPRVRMHDGAGHQIVEVQYDDGGGGGAYAFAWRGKRTRALVVGDELSIAPLPGQPQWSPPRGW